MPGKIIMMKGLPASGKSQKAKELVDQGKGLVHRVSKDDLRALYDGGKWSRAREKSILEIRDYAVFLAINQGHTVVVDDTNFEPKHEERLRQLADYDLTMARSEFEIMDFTHVPVYTCIERDSKRANPVGEKVIFDMWKKYLAVPESDRLDICKPRAYVADMDGTLADLNGRNPYDASTCEQDLPRKHVIELVKGVINRQASLIIVSGRYDTHRPETERWLQAHRIPFTELHMRKAGDNRPDTQVKKEIYKELIEPKWCVLAWVDDRPSVIQMVRFDLEIPVVDVGWGIPF